MLSSLGHFSELICLFCLKFVKGSATQAVLINACIPKNILQPRKIIRIQVKIKKGGKQLQV